ncbi:hypothetical protein H2200_013031 [Cladophialophora chaetospira]|uniref:O-methyltransferase domain-containing protein n=1 Tax=Cladophialophora chaetospira TaxID=386627 RepID=A0AA38WWK7_9EURO|nr:hypothetical protein H2200_013031 [Cladophialophora chaetospira]
MDDIARCVADFAEAAKGKSRHKTIDLAHAFIQTLETPADILQRVGYSHLQTTVTHLAIDLKIFEQLAEERGPLTDVQIAAASGAEVSLIARINRCLASYGMIDAVGLGTYAPNKVTRTFAQEAFRGAFMHMVLNVVPAWMQLPQVLADNNYKATHDVGKTVLNRAFGTSLPFFEYLKQHPRNMQAAGQYMGVWRDSEANWLNAYPFEEEVKRMTALRGNVNSNDEILFVDVGGALGHQCQLVRQKFPHLKGRVINQDLAEMLQAAPPPPDDVEFMVQDFFQPQQVREAPMFFYLRNVLHDWPDDSCVTILSHLRDALLKAPESAKILIDEMAVPEFGASRYVTNVDMVMMTGFGAKERTLAEWRILVGSVKGLKLSRSFTYENQLSMEVMEVEIA